MNHRPNYNNENLHKGIKKNTFKSQVTHLSSHRDYAITFAQNKTNSETFSRIEIILPIYGALAHWTTQKFHAKS